MTRRIEAFFLLAVLAHLALFASVSVEPSAYAFSSLTDRIELPEQRANIVARSERVLNADEDWKTDWREDEKYREVEWLDESRPERKKPEPEKQEPIKVIPIPANEKTRWIVELTDILEEKDPDEARHVSERPSRVDEEVLAKRTFEDPKPVRKVLKSDTDEKGEEGPKSVTKVGKTEAKKPRRTDNSARIGSRRGSSRPSSRPRPSLKPRTRPTPRKNVRRNDKTRPRRNKVETRRTERPKRTARANPRHERKARGRPDRGMEKPLPTSTRAPETEKPRPEAKPRIEPPAEPAPRPEPEPTRARAPDPKSDVAPGPRVDNTEKLATTPTPEIEHKAKPVLKSKSDPKSAEPEPDEKKTEIASIQGDVVSPKTDKGVVGDPGRKGETEATPTPKTSDAAEPPGSSPDGKTDFDDTSVESEEARKKRIRENLHPSLGDIAMNVPIGGKASRPGGGAIPEQVETEGDPDGIEAPRAPENFVPMIKRRGDITLLNAKSYKYAGFVRRVAKRIFDRFVMGFTPLHYAGPDYTAMQQGATYLAIMNKAGKTMNVKRMRGSGSANFDNLVHMAVEKGAWDTNVPDGAECPDGFVHFLFIPKIIPGNPTTDQAGRRVYSSFLIIAIAGLADCD